MTNERRNVRFWAERVGLGLATVCMVGVLSSCFSTQSMSDADARTMGMQLETKIWQQMKNQQLSDLKSEMSPAFQSVHWFGSKDRDAELELIKALKLGNYELSDWGITHTPDTLIVTYKVAVKETIEGKQGATQPAARMSTWQKINGQWMWTTHANLNAF